MRVRIGDEIWDKARVQRLIDTSDAAVARALMVIYANQTHDEQVAGDTKHHNNVGFTGYDAEWLSDIAEKWKQWGRWASERQCNAVRRSIRKYWRQLLEEMAQRPDAEVIKGRLPKTPAAEPELDFDPAFGDW